MTDLRKFAALMVENEYEINTKPSNPPYAFQIHRYLVSKAKELDATVELETFNYQNKWYIHFRLITPDMEVSHDVSTDAGEVTGRATPQGTGG